MSKFDEIKNQKPDSFLRDVGVRLETFMLILNKITNYYEEEYKENPMKKRGKKSSLCLEDMLLLTFYYLRHYPTFDQLGKRFGISESYACKIFHRITTILLNVLDMKSRHELLNKDLDTVLIDVTEQPIERPQKGQKSYYSGKKKQHTIKVQLIVCLMKLQILSVICRKGHVHDFRILKESKVKIHPDIKKIGDSGFQGMDKLYQNSHTPIKKTKNKPLTKEDKQYNRALSQQRVRIENVNRRCKIFRITKETYRGKHKNYRKTWNIIAGLVNLRYAA